MREVFSEVKIDAVNLSILATNKPRKRREKQAKPETKNKSPQAIPPLFTFLSYLLSGKAAQAY